MSYNNTTRPTRETKHSELQNNERGMNNKLHSLVPPKQEERNNVHRKEKTIVCGGKAVGQWQQDLEQFRVLWSVVMKVLPMLSWSVACESSNEIC
jgi:hypothetical protein